MRVVHLADLHLGFRAYNRVTSQGINRREADVFAAFREALEKTIALKPDLVLMAGDIFHVPRPTNLAICQTQRELVRFRSLCGAEIVVIAGNHESIKTADNRCILDLLSLIPDITVVTSKPEAVEVCGGKVKVFCLPHNALERLDQVQIAPDAEVTYNLLMLHGTVDSDRINDYGGYDIPEKVLQMPWDYVACGHYHSYTHLGRNAYYAGAIERTSNDIWKEAEEDKGFIEFDLETHKAKFHPLKSPRSTIDFPIIDAANYDAPSLDRLISDHVKQVDITDKLVRQRVINLPKSVQTQLDYRQLRSFQSLAVHYLLDLRSPQVGLLESKDLMPKSGGISERAKAFLQDRSLPSGLDRQNFVTKGLSYLQS
ncbi:DNA repair exonuclease [Synechococcus sp. PCC 7502]|uniref:metallophosphoesterase family protein n=1 Tax=Synechococcus sp. PCC 7502 TaxID=1173263 RepID=UPI00029FAC29|nr:DNA repair exonuclease [Synechococcus sp. PCC 7502]AFY73016.1 DNA repair exonuclease [Synechococcus sp. PCC 7502]